MHSANVKVVLLQLHSQSSSHHRREVWYPETKLGIQERFFQGLNKQTLKIDTQGVQAPRLLGLNRVSQNYPAAHSSL